MSEIIKQKIDIPSYVYINYIPNELINRLKEYCYNDLIKNKRVPGYSGKEKSFLLLHADRKKYLQNHARDGLYMSRNILTDDIIDNCIIDLKAYIYSTIKDICYTHNCDIVHKLSISIDRISYSHYLPGSYVKMHNHFPTTFVSSIYLDVDCVSSPIVFSKDHEVSIENGKCITHHGITNHRVDKTLGTRLMMACDVTVTSHDDY